MQTQLSENFGKWRLYLELFFGGGGKISLGAAPLSPSMEPLLLEICVGVTQRSLKMAHFGTVSNSHSIVTMALSFIFYSSSIVSKIKRNISRKSRFFHTLHSTPLSGASPLIRFCTENVRLPDGKKVWWYVQPFRCNIGVWQTDRRTDILRQHRSLIAL